MLLGGIALGALSCSTVVPSSSGIVRAPDARRRLPSPGPVALAVVGDIGTTSPETADLVAGIAERLRGSPEAPIVVTGDIFYRDGLLGVCPSAGGPPRSKRSCERPTSTDEQMTLVFGPYRRALPGQPVVAVAGNHDHYGDPQSTLNACETIPATEPGWRYLAEGCGLERDHPVATLDLGEVVVFVVDSDRMIQDRGYREAAASALRDEVERTRVERPSAWRVLAMHHPLESYGLHNGAHPLTALRKDFYWLANSVLLPITWLANRTVLGKIGHQDVYEWRYRAFRRSIYSALSEIGVDLVVSGHDHSLQLIRVNHPGVGFQMVSGAGAYRTPIKTSGLDLLFTNRAARAVGLGSWLPAPAHELVFGAGVSTGLGFAVLVPDGNRLVAEFYAAGSPEPLVVYPIERGEEP